MRDRACALVPARFMREQAALDFKQVAAARMGEATQAFGRDHPVAGDQQWK